MTYWKHNIVCDIMVQSSHKINAQNLYVHAENMYESHTKFMINMQSHAVHVQLNFETVHH